MMSWNSRSGESAKKGLCLHTENFPPSNDIAGPSWLEEKTLVTLWDSQKKLYPLEK
jgi:hypothetical protein